MRALADYVIARHDPEAAGAAQPYRALLDAVIARTAALVAQWMTVGFIHGVMNTDNVSIAGETIDYGPCAFMDTYHPGTVYSSIDHQGRYAFANQPRIAHWNLSRLAGSLLPLLGGDQDAAVETAQEALDAFPRLFQDAYVAGLRRKLGLQTAEDGDPRAGAGFAGADGGKPCRFHTGVPPARRSRWGSAHAVRRSRRVRRLGGRLASPFWRGKRGSAETRGAGMLATNPAVIPRNHRVEAVIRAAEDRGDFAPLDTLLAVLARPFEDRPEFADYADPPRPDEIVRQTFCGT